MDIVIKTSEKKILLYMLGIITGVRNNIIDPFDEVFALFFNPVVIKLLKDNNIKHEIIELVDMGREMEDIIELTPNELHNVLNQMERTIIQEIKKIDKIETINHDKLFSLL
jgi:hypothetical protein